jgi:hypothetical protein
MFLSLYYTHNTLSDRVLSYTFSVETLTFHIRVFSNFVPLKAKDVLIAKGEDVNIGKGRKAWNKGAG